MAGTAHLDVRDVTGDRVVTIEESPFKIGRRETNGLQLGGTEVSREHAEITLDGATYTLRDLASSYGTFVNDEEVEERALEHGDRIRLGRGGGADMVFAVGDLALGLSSRSGSDPVSEIQIVSALLEGLRALGPGRVLDEVLTLVLDSAITISGAERGFIMLASPEGTLELTLARGADQTTLDDVTFETSRKIPKDVFRTGQTQVATDLRDIELAKQHPETLGFGIRHVLCAPLHLVRFVEASGSSGDDRRLGVLYLDSRSEGSFLSATVRSGLETLAAEAAVAIENARLYREAAANAIVEQELRLAAEIQRMLLPKARIDLPFVEAAAASLPCRSIGGDFFDYADQEVHRFAFTLGDVAGKGPAAALLSALLQGMFSFAAPRADTPASVVSQVNGALRRRAIEARFTTLFYGVLDPLGQLVYCNGGHNPPFVFGSSGVRRLRTGGPIVGLLDTASYDDGTTQLAPGDRIVLFSDGVSEGFSKSGEEFGDDRILALLESVHATSPDMDAPSLVEALIAAVRVFALGAPQSDDITAMVVRYRGPGSA